MPMRSFHLPFIALAALLPAQVQAESLYVYGGVALEYTIEPNGPGSDNQTDLEPYLEVESSGFYAGVWGQLSSDETVNEVNLYLGYRGALDSGLSYDYAYTRYIYPDDGGDCCGELSLSFGIPLTDSAQVSFDAAYDPVNALSNGYISGDFYATDAIMIGTSYGYYETDGEPTATEWELTATYQINDTTSVKAGYYDSTAYDGYVALKLSFDTTLLSR